MAATPKFIFTLSTGVQVIIETATFKEARQQFDLIKQEYTDSGHTPTPFEKSAPTRLQTPKSLSEHLISLKDEGFFNTPKVLGDIKAKLEEKTIHRPSSTFPAYLNKLIRERILRRFKQTRDGKSVWVYVKH